MSVKIFCAFPFQFFSKFKGKTIEQKNKIIFIVIAHNKYIRRKLYYLIFNSNKKILIMFKINKMNEMTVNFKIYNIKKKIASNRVNKPTFYYFVKNKKANILLTPRLGFRAC